MVRLFFLFWVKLYDCLDGLCCHFRLFRFVNHCADFEEIMAEIAAKSPRFLYFMVLAVANSGCGNRTIFMCLQEYTEN